MVTLCNYYGMCDSNGKTAGHSVKVTNEYAKAISGLCKINLIASPCITNEVEKEYYDSVMSLPYNINIANNGILKRIFDKIHLFTNINHALKMKGHLFFYQTDFFFFLYLFLFYRECKDRQITILIYHQNFTGGKIEGILEYIYTKALDKIDCVIYTQKDKAPKHNHTYWIPDYAYNADLYGIGEITNAERLHRAIVLGTMNRFKKVEDVIDAFRHIDMQLLIVGKFDDDERYRKILSNLPSNVIVRNERIDYAEYIQLLTESQYSILPYDMNQYKDRTSGLLLESIYTGCICIAPEELLKQNRLPGLGYNSMDELVEQAFFDKTEEVISRYSDIYSEYSVESVEKVFASIFCNEREVV